MTRKTDIMSEKIPVLPRGTRSAPSAPGAVAKHPPRARPLDSAVDRNRLKRVKTLLRRALDGPLLPSADPDAALLGRLVAEGLLEPRDGRLHATRETAAYLRRALCDQAGDPFADQHRTLEAQTLVTPEGRRPVRRNLAESPLFSLLRLKEKDGRPFLTEDAVAAGDRLAADFEYGNLQPRITANWQPRLSSKAKGAAPQGPDLADSRIAARVRVNRAIEAMGPELAGVALDICCFGKGLEIVERERQWPARSAKLMLRTALMALARHYTPPPPKPRTRHWGDDGFRPEML